MSTNTPATAIGKIQEYFEKEIHIKQFALQVRRANHILAQIMMKPNAEENVNNSYWIEDCFYHLNSFAELIDPILENNQITKKNE